MHLLLRQPAKILPFSFFFFHSKKKTEGTYDLPYWDRAGNDGFMKFCICHFWFGVYVRSQQHRQFPLAETSLMLTDVGIVNFCSGQTKLLSSLNFFFFFFFPEIENALSHVKAYSFRFF